MRLDKWLWVARFYKTRSVASDAVTGGKVKLNQVNAKPAKELKIGDRLQLRAGDEDWEVIIRGFNNYRRPAPEARELYEETPESSLKRARAAELRALAPMPDAEHRGRPTKRDRRLIHRFREIE